MLPVAALAAAVTALGAPTLPTLPAEGFAVQAGRDIVLRGPDRVLARLSGYALAPRSGLRGPVLLRDARGGTWRIDVQHARLVRARPASQRRPHAHGCAVASSPSLLLCRGDGPAHAPQLIQEWRGDRLHGIAAYPPRPKGIRRADGHWVDAVVSPDGRTILAQWSGECESPSAVLVRRGDGRLFPAGGSWGDESIALGWLHALAAVDFPQGLCGGTHGRPGVYTLLFGGRPHKLFEHGPRTAVEMWGG